MPVTADDFRDAEFCIQADNDLNDRLLLMRDIELGAEWEAFGELLRCHASWANWAWVRYAELTNRGA